MSRFALLPALVLAAAVQPGHAQVIVETPRVRVQVGQPGVLPRPLPVRPVSPGGLPPVVVAPVPPPPSFAPPLPPPPPPPPGRAVRVMTPEEFAVSARCLTAGSYEVTLLHPCTNCPVKVCFSLPVRPRKVVLRGNNLEFRWGLFKCKAVIVSFMPNGQVLVRG